VYGEKYVVWVVDRVQVVERVIVENEVVIEE